MRTARWRTPPGGSVGGATGLYSWLVLQADGVYDSGPSPERWDIGDTGINRTQAAGLLLSDNGGELGLDLVVLRQASTANGHVQLMFEASPFGSGDEDDLVMLTHGTYQLRAVSYNSSNEAFNDTGWSPAFSAPSAHASIDSRTVEPFSITTPATAGWDAWSETAMSVLSGVSSGVLSYARIFLRPAVA